MSIENTSKQPENKSPLFLQEQVIKSVGETISKYFEDADIEKLFKENHELTGEILDEVKNIKSSKISLVRMKMFDATITGMEWLVIGGAAGSVTRVFEKIRTGDLTGVAVDTFFTILLGILAKELHSLGAVPTQAVEKREKDFLNKLDNFKRRFILQNAPNNEIL